MSTSHLPYQLPEHIATAEDYVPLAREKLSQQAWAYLQGGAGKGLSIGLNRLAFDKATITPRPLRRLEQANTTLQLFGQSYAHPFILAPVGYQKIFHADGEMASAIAANAQSGQMVVSSLASQTVEQIQQAAEQALWFQLYWQGTRELTLRLLKRAIAANYKAIMFTVDAPVKQASMVLPSHVKAVNQEAPLAALSTQSQQSVVFDGWMAQAPTWEDVAWLREQTTLPLMIKGVMHADDAKHAEALGCDAVVVSNHGGRVLDGTPSSLEVLPAIKKALSCSTKVLFDSGIRTGQDAYKALALGADAVMIGRPYIWGLAVAGAMGVAHVIRTMRDELEMTMALTGVSQLTDIYFENENEKD